MIDNIIRVDEHSNRFIYPYMTEYFDAVRNHQGFAFDICTGRCKKVRMIVERDSSVEVMVKDEDYDKYEYNLHLSNLIEGVPLFGDAFETITLRGTGYYESTITEFNKNATDKIHSFLIVPAIC